MFNTTRLSGALGVNKLYMSARTLLVYCKICYYIGQKSIEIVTPARRPKPELLNGGGAAFVGPRHR
jgi:hypothetical protein